MMMRMTMSDFIEVCKFNEAINRDIEEEIIDDSDDDDDDGDWWEDLRTTERIKEAIEQRHENEFYDK